MKSTDLIKVSLIHQAIVTWADLHWPTVTITNSNSENKQQTTHCYPMSFTAWHGQPWHRSNPADLTGDKSLVRITHGQDARGQTAGTWRRHRKRDGPERAESAAGTSWPETSAAKPRKRMGAYAKPLCRVH